MAVTAKNTKALDLAFDRMAELAVAEEHDYPSKLELIPADTPHFLDALSRALSKDTAILIVYPDGRERLISAPTKPS
jgi:hypothetical protein